MGQSGSAVPRKNVYLITSKSTAYVSKTYLTLQVPAAAAALSTFQVSSPTQPHGRFGIRIHVDDHRAALGYPLLITVCPYWRIYPCRRLGFRSKSIGAPTVHYIDLYIPCTTGQAEQVLLGC